MVGGKGSSAYKPKYSIFNFDRGSFSHWAAVLRQALCTRVRKDGLVNPFGYFRH